MPVPPYSIGIDTGGTFTDLVRIDGAGRLSFEKSFSTPDAPEDAVFDVLRALAADDATGLHELLSATTRFGHGTTVSTNALIERRGARVGLITTRGFEDTHVVHTVRERCGFGEGRLTIGHGLDDGRQERSFEGGERSLSLNSVVLRWEPWGVARNRYQVGTMRAANQVLFTVEAQAARGTRHLEHPPGNAAQGQADHQACPGATLEPQPQLGVVLGGHLVRYVLGVEAPCDEGLQARAHRFDRSEHPLDTVDQVSTGGT